MQFKKLNKKEHKMETKYWQNNGSGKIQKAWKAL